MSGPFPSFLDDVTLSWRPPLALRFRPVTHTEETWTEVMHGVVLRWDGDVAKIKISVPKVMGERVNFPGHPECTAQHLAHISRAVRSLIRLPVPHVATWMITQAAVTADVRPDDVQAVLRGAKTLTRRNDRRGADAYGENDAGSPVERGTSGLIWRAGGRPKRGVGFSLYDKERELVADHGYAGRDAARDARGVLRMTATTYGVDTMREHVRGCSSGQALTLAAWLRTDVRDAALGRQLARLGVDRVLDGADVTDTTSSRALRVLDERYGFERAAQLLFVFQALRDSWTVRRLVERTGRSKQSISDDKAALKRLDLDWIEGRAERTQAARMLREACAPFLAAAEGLPPMVLESELVPSPFARLVDEAA